MPTSPKSRPPERSRVVPVVEIIGASNELVTAEDKAIGVIDDLNKAVHVYSGEKAFRIYQASTDLIGKNAGGTLQGMVKSARWRTVFRISSDVGEKIEVLAFLAIFAENITEAAPEFETIWTSKDSSARKAVHLTRLADTLGTRTAMGLFTAGVSTIYEVLKGWCLLGTLVPGKFGAAANSCVSVIEDADFRVKTAGKALADIAAQANPIINTIDIVLH